MKIIGLVLMALVLWVLTDRQQKDMGIMLNLAVCAMVITAAAWYIKPLLDLIWQLNALGNLHDGILNTLIKAVGIGFVGETAATVCKDGGNSSMEHLVRLFASTAIVYVSIPVFQKMMDLIQDILGIL